jgi:hypothetical protein
MPIDKPEDVVTLLGPRLYIWAGHNPMPKRCKDCPFLADERGEDFLAPGRLVDIKVATLLGQPFHCHKSIYQPKVEWEVDDEGEQRKPDYHRLYRQCAGALDWAKGFLAERGAVALVNGDDPDG